MPMELKDDHTIKYLESKWQAARTRYERKTRESDAQRQNIPIVIELGKISREFMDLKGKQRILDVACGNGFMDGTSYADMGYKYIDDGHDLYGVDVIEYPDFPGTFNLGSAEELPYNDGFFDVVVCFSALTHFVNPGKVFSEAARVLKPKGFYYVTTSILHNEPYPWISMYPNHIFEYSVRSIAALYKEAGFGEVTAREGVKPTYLFRGVKK